MLLILLPVYWFIDGYQVVTSPSGGVDVMVNALTATKSKSVYTKVYKFMTSQTIAVKFSVLNIFLFN